MSLIDIPKIKDNIEKYIEEFYSKPRKLKTFSTPYMNLMRKWWQDIILDVIIFNSLKKGDKNMIMTQQKDVVACLHQKKGTIVGKGGFGKIYKVGPKMVAKIATIGLYYASPDVALRVMREAKIATKAGELGVGPKVHQSYGCCSKTEGCVYVMYMDWLKGMPLNEWLTKKKSDVMLNKVKDILKKKLALLNLVAASLCVRNLVV